MRPKRSRKGPFSGNLERRFRRFRETRCPERARLLDTTVEDIMVVEQAPPSSMLNQPALRQQYCHHVLALHERLQGGPRPTRIRAGPGAKGVPGAPKEGQGPETEAAFGRKRAAAISDVMAASPGKQQRMVESAPPGRGRSGDGGSRRNCIRAGRRAGCQARRARCLCGNRYTSYITQYYTVDLILVTIKQHRVQRHAAQAHLAVPPGRRMAFPSWALENKFPRRCISCSRTARVYFAPKWPRGTVVRAPLCRSLLVSWEHCPAGQ